MASAIASFHSPLGADLAFGAEYFFTTSFSLGAEVFGLRIAHVDATCGSPGCVNGGGPKVSVNENYFTLYTGVSLNYRFLATASVHTYEEEEDQENPRPKRKTRRAPPPRNNDEEAPPEAAPAPSPESVD
jgi:hypothetical protein